MTASNKDVIYIDIDDEITSIIDKVRASKERIVALVLPKRAAMLQSSVNMKLLKRASDDAKKNLVLITSEAGLLPLAGMVGLRVAKTLQSKPEIPSVGEDALGAAADDILPLDEVESPDEEFDTAAASDKPIGELAAATPLAAAAYADDEVDTIELDNAPAADNDTDQEADTAGKKNKSANKKLKVPDFEKFRLRLIIGAALLLLLIAGFVLANIILPKATIAISTNSSTVNSNLSVTLDSTVKVLDPQKLVIPAQVQQTQKTSTQQITTTGQKNQGTKANGSLTLSLTDCSQPSVTVPAGTGLSTNGLTFITQNSATLSSVMIAGKCKNSSFPSLSSANVNVIAQNPGTQYNVAASTFQVAGFSNVQGTSSNAMSGGTDSIVKVVAQADINNAKQKLSTQDTNAVKTELQNALQVAGLSPVNVTFNAGTQNITASAQIGDQADTITVTGSTTYTMFGMKQTDLQKLIDNDINKQIDTSKQAILDDGLNKANFNAQSQSSTSAEITVQTTAVAGSHLDVNSLKQQVAGKKSGDVKTIIGSNPGVTGVTVHYSPFWVSSTPKNLSKIVIVFQKVSSNAASKP